MSAIFTTAVIVKHIITIYYITKHTTDFMPHHIIAMARTRRRTEQAFSDKGL